MGLTRCRDTWLAGVTRARQQGAGRALCGRSAGLIDRWCGLREMIDWLRLVRWQTMQRLAHQGAALSVTIIPDCLCSTPPPKHSPHLSPTPPPAPRPPRDPLLWGQRVQSFMNLHKHERHKQTNNRACTLLIADLRMKTFKYSSLKMGWAPLRSLFFNTFKYVDYFLNRLIACWVCNTSEISEIRWSHSQRWCPRRSTTQR